MKCKFLLQSALILGVCVLSSQCSSKGASKTEEPVKPSVSCKVHEAGKGAGLVNTEKWQTEFLETLCKSKEAKEGWALFQEGGFTGEGDFGQVMLISEAKPKTYLPALTPRDPQGRESHIVQLQSHDVKDASFAKFKKTVQKHSAGLPEHWPDKIFDAMEYEFVHVEKKNDELYIKQRVKWRFGSEKCEAHCKVSDAFKKLLKH